jgi:rRNA maturation endonuclease Nob1
MGEIYDRQKIQQDLQRSDEFLNVFSKVVSGKAGYKAVIEMKPITAKCPGCSTVLDERQKFCHECGAKNDSFKPEKK